MRFAASAEGGGSFYQWIVKMRGGIGVLSKYYSGQFAVSFMIHKDYCGKSVQHISVLYQPLGKMTNSSVQFHIKLFKIFPSGEHKNDVLLVGISVTYSAHSTIMFSS